LDINPVRKGHTLLVPKEEHTWMTDTPDEQVGYLFIKAKEIMQQMKDKL
jgi:histidine triad (HIT) family protein